MGVRLKGVLGAIALTTGLTTLTGAALAQDASTASRPSGTQTPLQVLEDAFFRHSGDFYDNDSIVREAGVLLGPFPENNITRDAAATNRVYNNLLVIQGQSDRTIRTADLETPFTASLLTLPRTSSLRDQSSNRTIEFVPPPTPAPAPVAPPPARPAGPVRALF